GIDEVEVCLSMQYISPYRFDDYRALLQLRSLRHPSNYQFAKLRYCRLQCKVLVRLAAYGHFSYQGLVTNVSYFYDVGARRNILYSIYTINICRSSCF